MSETSLKSSIVFITGASSGIGAACARAFATEGARLLLAARRVERLEAMEVDLLEAGAAAVHAIRLDVKNHAAVEQALAELPQEWQAIDVLVNNAGLSRGLEKLWEGKTADWEEMIDTNVKGLLWVTRSVVRGMVARGRGHVVNLGSTAGELAYPGGSVYCGSKAAVKLINDGLRQDVMGTPVRVTCIEPGMVETEFSEVRFHGDKDRAAKVYANITPLTSDDVADAIVWATTRPARVNIAHMLMTTVDQANSLVFNRRA
ncbi:MAG TPA: SDR family NAD(P)-dependent oxidoreductase [Acidobacteriaceae bacterium]|jgi:3-hydroxy acid dehydrogenase / malonic semialdehyde reductase|nr:SDR family NAD(P)-dependent oxidoreductase [Acidobacteriaceae bacterium]